MKKLNRNEIILVSLCVALMIVYGYYSLFLSPVLNKISGIKTSISQNTDMVNHINTVKISNKKLNDNLAKLQEKYETAAKALPKSARNPEVTYDIKALADSNTVTINSLTIGSGTEYKHQTNNAQNENNSSTNTKANSPGNAVNGKLMNLPVTVNISGDYVNMMKFIGDIEKDKRIAEVNNINFVVANTGALQGTISVNYYYADYSNTENKYEFNNGSYGKDNLFK